MSNFPEGSRVRVRVRDLARVATYIRDVLNGQPGTVEECSETYNWDGHKGPARLVRFDNPIDRGGHLSPLGALWFEPEDLEPLT